MNTNKQELKKLLSYDKNLISFIEFTKGSMVTDEILNISLYMSNSEVLQ